MLQNKINNKCLNNWRRSSARVISKYT